jgi:hypothetical protein
MVDLVYNEFKFQHASGTINLLNNTIKVMLVSDGYVPDPDHQFIDDGTIFAPAAFELTGTGYTPGFGGSGRRTLANKSITKDLATDRARFFADDIVWNPINAGVAGAAIIIREVSGDSDSILVAYVLSGGFPILTDGGELQLRWSNSGIFSFS